MTRRRNLEQHRRSLGEIREIMESMKTLAYMETRKLARFLEAQQAAVKSIEEAAADFLSFYPDILPDDTGAPTVFLLIGTERGFCGDFNHSLVRELEARLTAAPVDNPLLIATGRKLHMLLEEDARLVASIDGANVAEEVTPLLSRLVEELMSLHARHGGLTVFCLYHGGQEDITVKRILPPFQQLLDRAAPSAYPPEMNLPPRELLAELTEHFLFAALHEIFYSSLSAESHDRVRHLEGAVRHLDEEEVDLARQCNILRQEEITEEIEVILLGSSGLTPR